MLYCLKWEKRRFFAYMTTLGYHVIQNDVENPIFTHNWIFRHTCVYKQPHWQSSGTITFLYKFYVVISDTLEGFFFNVLFLLLAVILSEFYGKPRRNKDWVTEKCTWKSWCTRHHFFDCTTYLLYFFLLFSLSTLKWRPCWMAPIKIHNVAVGGILCNFENMKISCNLILAGWLL